MIALNEIKIENPFEAQLVEKERNLRSLMRETGKVLVAFSGGVDSAYLAKIASEELGRDARCILGLSPSVSEFQRTEALSVADKHRLQLKVIDTKEIEDPNYAANPTNRCYFCKSELYSTLKTYAVDGEAIFDGTNADDLKDHRPGRAAATENDVRSPLADLGFTKREIRELSRRIGLETWDKPASPCLSSRIAHGVPVTIGRLSQVERSEAYLRGLGLREFRVRVHDGSSRIEVAKSEMYKVLDENVLATIEAKFREIGFKYVTLDLSGFRSGSLNIQEDTVG